MTTSPDRIEIRPIGPRDRAAWLPLWRGYQAFYKVDLSEADGALRVALGQAPFASEKPAVVWLLQVSRTATVPIERGENTGKTVTYANVVRGISRIGEPAMARIVVPTYQPTLKKSERSRRPIISKVFASDVLLVCQLVVA